MRTRSPTVEMHGNPCRRRIQQLSIELAEVRARVPIVDPNITLCRSLPFFVATRRLNSVALTFSKESTMKTFGPKPTCHHGYERDRYLVSVLCTIIVALGGCSATASTPDNRVMNASAPGVQASSVTAPTEQATTTTQVDSCAEDPDPRYGQVPCSCFGDYFWKTRTKPWCTALDWAVGVPALLLLAPIALIGGV
jgi:hypothetical protein